MANILPSSRHCRSCHSTPLRLSNPSAKSTRTTLCLRPRRRSVAVAAALRPPSASALSDADLHFLRRAAVVSKTSAGLYRPHPFSGCVLVHPDGQVISEAHQVAQGTASAESQAVHGVDALGATAYLNLEPSDAETGVDSVKALHQAGVQRVVLGMLHPFPHLRNQAFQIEVSLLGTNPCSASEEAFEKTLLACLEANEAVLHRAVTHKPMSVLKYAMTLDGKIAAASGHSAWVSCPMARQRVFETRALSNAVIVGGNTVRRDNPNLTTRRENGFFPTRIVMTRTLDLQKDANLWKVDVAPTIVMTQRGVRSDFQQELRDRGIEVVEFDFLSPESVANYCYQNGFLQILWECGGALSAPAIASGVIHKVMAFVSPKIIGGTTAPTPCGDLGFVEMTQAVKVTDLSIEQIGPDVMMKGYLPPSGGLAALHEAAENLPLKRPYTTSPTPSFLSADVSGTDAAEPVVQFYVTWDKWGAFSNFAIYPIYMADGPGPHNRRSFPNDPDGTLWPSTEHYYQAQKFAGVDDPIAIEAREMILGAATAEAAALIGRATARRHPSLVRHDWLESRIEIMSEALQAKFTHHPGPRALLLSTGSRHIVENSPRDEFWGCGVDGKGENHLGKLLMSVRASLQKIPFNSQNTHDTIPTMHRSQ